MIRFLWLILIVCLLLTQFFWLGVLLALWYMFLYRGYELMLVAILIDGYFGAFYSVPYLSLITILLVFMVDLLKPRLLMYTGLDEMVS